MSSCCYCTMTPVLLKGMDDYETPYDYTTTNVDGQLQSLTEIGQKRRLYERLSAEELAESRRRSKVPFYRHCRLLSTSCSRRFRSQTYRYLSVRFTFIVLWEH